MRVLIAVLAAAAALAPQRGPEKPDDAGMIISSERNLYAALASADTSAFQALTLPEGIWTTPTGFVPMGPLAQGLGSFRLPKWAIENPHVVWTDGNTALVLYIRTGGGTYEERPFSSMMLASTVWTKRNGRWVALHHQESEFIQ